MISFCYQYIAHLNHIFESIQIKVEPNIQKIPINNLILIILFKKYLHVNIR
jgi:hypothetical protein